MEAERERLKKVACATIDAAADDLAALSAGIWEHPELNFEEHHAHKVLADFLERHGFETQRSYKLETAFRASHGSRAHGPNVTFICEYDALPEIGHACGHNLIAELGVAAGLGLKAAIEASGKPLGQVTVVGTPAEEGGGGKGKLIEHGAFDDVDVAMMSHPFPANDAKPRALAIEIFEVVYRGQESHAAGYPWKGVNALDAAVMCYQGLACLRQQCMPDWRIHCIILEGGVKVNVIPAKTRLHVGIRAPTDAQLARLKEKAMNVIEAAAKATECQFEHSVITKYASVLHNGVLADLYSANLSDVQAERGPEAYKEAPGSTDMGDVSHVLPAIHPMFYIGGTAVNHTRAFTADSGAACAQMYTLAQAKALALTGVDILTDPSLMDAITADFRRGLKEEQETAK
ncbi:xaa-Arg dipeptidase-like [Dreissena polymorpha]|nr:xaa-Arg dipeptidase-like [Dreissena polymorpha]XP_052286683.1 xaa-Arg dipeptidase-like [Dreissena polymorpha]